jgi:hypothetical protein
VAVPIKPWRTVLKVHEAAEAFPLMTESEVKELCLWQVAQIIFAGRQALRRHARKSPWEP